MRPDSPRGNIVKPEKLFIPALLLAGLSGFCPGALARAKTDVVTLYNGDRITGEIKSLYAGLLELKTDSMDRVKIEWQSIARVKSDYMYLIRLSSGVLHYGAIEDSPIPGQFVVRDDDHTLALNQLQVVELRQVDDAISERIDARLSAGFSYTKASSVAQTTLNGEVSYETRRARNSLTGRITLTNTNEESTRSSKLALERRRWTNREKYFRILFANYETNDELALDYRVSSGVGLGRYFIDTQKMQWVGSSALQIITEKGEVEGHQQSIELLLGTDYSMWRFDTPELELRFGFNLYPSMTESGRVRGDSDITLNWELIKDLFWQISAYGTFDNEADTGKQFDYGVTTGIGWKY
jgi:hypothetical protein